MGAGLALARPQSLTRDGNLTYICWSHNAADLFHRVQVWTQPSVHREDLLVNDGSNWQAIEAVGKGLPQFYVISPLALIIKAVDTVDRSALMVSPKNEKVLRILDLVRQKQAYRLERLLTSVYIVSKEKVVGFRGESSVLEKPEEIVVLTMYVSADL